MMGFSIAFIIIVLIVLYSLARTAGESDHKHVLRNSTPREWRRQNSPIRRRKGDSKMNKKNFNVVGNNETENQELAKGIAFIKSRRAELNVVQMVENMRDQALPNGVIINDAYCDRSMTRDYDREALNAFFATLKEEDFEVVVVRSLNDITDDIYDLEEFVKTITDMGIWLYSLEVGPVPITASHAEDFGC